MSVTIPIPQQARDTGSCVFRAKVAGREYELRVQWNQRASQWTLDIADQDGVMIVAGIVLVVGFPLLSLVTDARRPPGELAIWDTQQRGEDPTLDSFGARHLLIYWDPS
jgi:hypothetical protein